MVNGSQHREPLAQMIDHGAAERRYRRGSTDKQAIRITRPSIKYADTRNEFPAIGQIHVVAATGKASLSHPVILRLERPGGMNHQRRTVSA